MKPVEFMSAPRLIEAEDVRVDQLDQLAAVMDRNIKIYD